MIDLLRPRLAALVATLLTATALLPMVQGWRWLGELALIITVAMLIESAVAKLWRPSGGAIVAVLVAALGVNAVYAGAWSLLRVIPTPASVEALRVLLTQGAEAVYQLQAPLPGSTGVRALMIVGLVFAWWGVDVLVGVTASPALAGVPLLAIVLPAAALSNDGLPWWGFLAAGAGYLMLLIGGDRRRAGDWGRLVGGARPPRLGRVIEPVFVIASVLALALLLPIFVPNLANRLVPPANGRWPSGAIAVLNPILNLHDDLTSRNNQSILTYTTDSQVRQPIRVVSDDAFDGNTWHPSYGQLDRDDRAQDGLPQPPGLSANVPFRLSQAHVRIDSLKQSWLPTPYPPQLVSELDGDWLYNPDTLNIVGDHITTTPGMTYQLTYYDISPTPAQLNAAPASDEVISDPRWTDLPSDLPGSIALTADRVAGNGSQYQQAMRLQTWLRSGGGFSYSEQAPPDNGSGAIADFLERKRGYCVHFASTMAVMARTLGIPARVAVGFQPGQRQADGSYLVRQRDAHAWPELYFAGVGWVYFEPTPAAQVPRLPAYATPSTPAPSATPTSSTTTSASPSVAPSSALPTPTPTSTAAATPRGSTTRYLAPAVLAVLLALVLILAPSLLAATIRRRRWRRARDAAGVLEAGWQELLDRLTDLGIPVPRATTVRQVAARLGQDLDPAPAAALAWLAEQVEQARYAPMDRLGTIDSAQLRARVRRDVATIVAGVAEQRGRSSQWRAKIRPRSGTQALRDARDRALRR